MKVAEPSVEVDKNLLMGRHFGHFNFQSRDPKKNVGEGCSLQNGLKGTGELDVWLLQLVSGFSAKRSHL